MFDSLFVEHSHGPNKVRNREGRYGVLQQTGELAQGCGVLFWHRERPLPHQQASDPVPQEGRHRQRFLHLLH
ncbi:unnamed protein product, partial [Pylaiella littoralis]